MNHLQHCLPAAVAAVTLTCLGVAQDAVGVIADRGSGARQPYAHVFDPATMQITASVPLPLPNFADVFDVEIAPDLSEAYVGHFSGSEVFVIDLTTNPPSLAAGTNPIDLFAATSGALGGDSASVADLALSADGRYLVVTGGNSLADGGSAMAVVDLTTRAVTDRHDFSPNSPIAVDVGPDGSVAVVELLESQPSFADTNVRRFVLSDDGLLADTGESATVADIPGVQNVIIPGYPFPGMAWTARHVVHVSRPAGQTLGSLVKNGLAVRDDVTLDYPTGIDTLFDPTRSILYARANEQPTSGGAGVGNARIEGFLFHAISGLIGPRIVSIDLDRRAGTAFGVEQTALDPGLGRLYVSGLAGGEVRVFDGLTGAQLGTITHPDFLFGLGIKVRRR